MVTQSKPAVFFETVVSTDLGSRSNALVATLAELETISDVAFRDQASPPVKTGRLFK